MVKTGQYEHYLDSRLYVYFRAIFPNYTKPHHDLVLGSRE